MNSKKKNFRFAALVTALCVVVAYFAVLSPTTAYYYKIQEEDLDVNFSLFDVSQTVSEDAVNFDLKDGTKFEDFDEVLFDKVAYVKTVSLTNVGETDAKVYVNVNVAEESAQNGLKYIVLFDNTTDEGTDDLVTVKSQIESTLSTFDTSFVAGISETNAVQILDLYNESYLGYEAAPLVAAGESCEVKIVFWAEYGMIENTLKDTSNIADYSYSAEVSVTATQNTEEAAPANA